MAEPLLGIEGLRTHFFTSEGVLKAVDGVDLSVPAGRTVCLVGESGCGKSVTARSILQLVDRPGRIVEGSIRWKGATDLAGLDPAGEELRRVRGGEIGMIFQEPMASLSPMYTVGAQLSQALRLHRDLTRQEAREEGVALLRKVGLPDAGRRFDAYPFQMSGGMCQRVMIAIALCCDPALLIADEPTTALDVTTQARILDLMMDLRAQNDMAILFITHDLGVVAEIADEVAVMYLGKVVEHGTVEQIFSDPRHPYTRALLRSIPELRGSGARRRLTAIRGMVPSLHRVPDGCPFHTRCDHAIDGLCDTAPPPLKRYGEAHVASCHLDEVPAEPPAVALQVAERAAPAAETAGPLLRVEGLAKHYPIGGGLFRRPTGVVRAVDGVDLTIPPGRTLGLVGESGCGKTTLGRCVARLADPTAGRILYRTASGEEVDLATVTGARLKEFRREIRVIFQDPFSSLNPRMTLKQIVGEPLKTHGLASGGELTDRVADMLARVGLRPEYMRRYPHAFSGGQRQRINIARALITGPRLVVADEPVSALDVSVRAQILNLLTDLQEELGLTYLFISHDLSVVEHISDRVTVMYLGKVVEDADTAGLYREPRHPYTEALLHAVPVPDPGRRRERHAYEIADDLPDPAAPPPGCRFHTRCAHVRDGLCRTDVPDLRAYGEGRRAACHHAAGLTLAGVGSMAREAEADGPMAGRDA
ncbi:ABC transporter ATP-binding protein [Nonomuraea angiospora]|uniref:ABC transporter ATP-binding protein n=1 Tax=Nonomuraea angiospora TaxID=46172 RepID=UPI0029B0F290|nr:ABC transporter ATP-binding protein [Nonomuraea angiospora]MDX3101994.1 ABC transporter ATP-binding protein [Nonomuraea angiospora]